MDGRKVLDHGFVSLLSHMGSDLTVANAARVSFSKRTETFEEKDAKLIRYLAKHNHWTPFAHPQITLHIKLPIFVARQLMRSTVGVVYNEVSRRYVDDEPEFYEPSKWRSRPTGSVKQGSSDNPLPVGTDSAAGLRVHCATGECVRAYEAMLEWGIAPEMARMVLPLNTYTEFWMTASLAALARIVKLRDDSHAQWEIQQYAKAVGELVEPLFPVSWKALMENDKSE